MSRLGQTTTVKQTLRDLASLVARVGVGGICFANGWTKLEDGLNTTGAKFLAQGAPAPRAWATITMLTELIGGALLIALPHLIGAPSPVGASPVPSDLSRQFAIASVVTQAAFWILLGGIGGPLYARVFPPSSLGRGR